MKNSILFLLFFPLCSWANVATIKELRGNARIENTPAGVGDSINEGDTIRTGPKSLAIISFNDRTRLTIGPEAKIVIRTFKELEGKRNIHIKFIQGQVRSLINRHARPGEKLRFDAQLVTLGIRGTEFITNSYHVNGAPSTDTVLLKGSLQARGVGFEPFMMKPGQYFNSQEIVKYGIKAVKTLDAKGLNELKKDDFHLTNRLQSPHGFSAPGIAQAPELATTTTLSVPTPIRKKERAAKAPPKSFQYDISKEPWDIRDAIINRKKNKKENKCYYFFYKKLPGAGEAERFRRERSCDEFEFDL